MNRFNSINANSVNANRLSNRAVSSNTWQHNADHRRGVGYTNPQVRQQYRPNSAGNAATRDAFRGLVRRGRRAWGRQGSAPSPAGICQTPQGRTRQARATCKEIWRTHRDRTQQARATRQAIWPTHRGRMPAVAARISRADRRTRQRPNPAGAGNAQARLQNVQRPSGGRGAPAFNGVGHGAATRAQSAQGHASRAGAAHGGGVARGGGGARAGGGAARGGRR